MQPAACHQASKLASLLLYEVGATVGVATTDEVVVETEAEAKQAVAYVELGWLTAYECHVAMSACTTPAKRRSMIHR